MIFSTAFAASPGGEKSNFFVETASFLGIWGLAVLIFILTFPVAAVLKKIVVSRIASATHYDYKKEVLILFERSVYFLVVILGSIIAFSIVGIDLGSVIAFLGFGIGFAFKDLLANFIAGVVILTQKKFKIDDIISVGEKKGRITEIDVRTTQIHGFDGTDYVVPNSEMLTNIVQNFSANEVRRVEFEVGVDYSTPLEKAIELTILSVKKSKNVLPDPEVQVLVKDFGPSAILLDIRFWVVSSAFWPAIKSEVITQLKKDFDSVGISIPFPIRTLQMAPPARAAISAKKA